MNPGKESHSRLLERLRLRYISALVLIAILVLLGQILIQRFLLTHTEILDRTLAMDHQVRLGRELSKEATALQLATALSQRKQTLSALEQHQSRLKKYHQGLRGLTFPDTDTDAGSVLDPGIAELDDALQRLGEALNAAPGSGRQYDVFAEADRIRSAATGYSERVTRLREFFDNENRRRVELLRRAELVLTFLTLLLLLLEGIFVFKPAIQELRTAFQELIYQRARAEEAFRVRSDFLSKMSHEIRNPLNAILGATSLLTSTELSRPQKRFLEIVRRSTSSLRSLLENLLDFSKIEAGKLTLYPTECELPTVVENALDHVTPMAEEKGLELVLDFPVTACHRVLVDATRLTQVLTNLLGNAVKFTDSGEVLLQVREVKTGDGVHMRFTVADTGVGIPPSELNRIFQSFEQASSAAGRRHGGAGLGLTICQQLVQAMGGKLEVESKPGQGTRFTFDIPTPVAGPAEAYRILQGLHIDGRVLLVCLHPTMAEILRVALRRQGARVTVMDSENLSSEQLGNFLDEGEVHAVLAESKAIDSGFMEQLTRRNLAGRLLALVATNRATEEIRRASYFGVSGFLFKPVSPPQVLKELAILSHAPAPDAPTPPLAVASTAAPLRILAVDDSPENRLILKAYFTQSPHLLDFAEDGRKAVQCVRAHPYDLILMDLDMPVMGGGEAAREIRKLESRVGRNPAPILALTAFDPEEADAAVFTRHLKKPVERAALFAAIAEVAGAESQKEEEKPPTEDRGAVASRTRLSRLAPKYLSSRQAELKRLVQAWERGDLETVGRITHNVKGTAATYGFAALGDSADHLHQAAVRGDRQGAERELEKYQNILTELRQPNEGEPANEAPPV